jgi:DNA-binding transcriptional MerR regulator
MKNTYKKEKKSRGGSGMSKAVFTSEAAKVLGIGVSTLRNYAVVLESKGYGFERGANNGRIFREMDLHNIKEMTKKISEEGMTVEQAAQATVAQAAGRGEAVLPSEKDAITVAEKIHHLEEQQAKLEHINRLLAAQVERLEEKIKERERDQLLFERLEQSRNKKKKKGIAFFRTFMTFSDKKISP